MSNGTVELVQSEPQVRITITLDEAAILTAILGTLLGTHLDSTYSELRRTVMEYNSSAMNFQVANLYITENGRSPLNTARILELLKSNHDEQSADAA